MRWLRREMLAVAVSMFVLSTADAEPVKPVDVAFLTQRADVIVLGQIRHADDLLAKLGHSQDSPSRVRPAVSFTAIKALKGNLDLTNTTSNFTIATSPYHDIYDADYGIFFLRRENGSFVPVEPAHPFLPAVEYADHNGDALSQVTSILRNVLVSNVAGAESRRTALDALARLNTTAARDALREAMNQSQGDQRLLIASKLIARDDIAGLETVKSALLNPTVLSRNLFLTLAGAIGGLKDQQAIPSLAILAQANSVDIRRSVAVALRQIRSPESVRPLSGLLNDNDSYVRYYAVSGLGEITDQDDWTPSFDEFQEHEEYYLSHWRNWAEVNVH